MQPSTDIELVSRLCCEQATESDWRKFYDGYQALIRQWCQKAGVSSSELDDVFHDILIKLVDGVASYERRGGHRFRSWLKTVVVNSLTDRLRISGSHPFPSLVSNLDVFGGDELSGMESLGELADGLTEKTSSAATILARVRKRVKVATWNAFVQRELLQLDVAAVAAELGVKKASVYQSCSRVRAIIKEESESYFGNRDKD